MARQTFSRYMPAAELTKQLNITVKIKGFNGLRIRLWIGKKLIKLATFVIGCGLEIEQGGQETDT